MTPWPRDPEWLKRLNEWSAMEYYHWREDIDYLIDYSRQHNPDLSLSKRKQQTNSLKPTVYHLKIILKDITNGHYLSHVVHKVGACAA